MSWTEQNCPAPKAAGFYGFVAAIPSREFRDGMGTRNASVTPNLLPRLDRRFQTGKKCLATQWVGKLRRRIDQTPQERKVKNPTVPKPRTMGRPLFCLFHRHSGGPRKQINLEWNLIVPQQVPHLRGFFSLQQGDKNGSFNINSHHKFQDHAI